jgi:hypothetical protein
MTKYLGLKGLTLDKGYVSTERQVKYKQVPLTIDGLSKFISLEKQRKLV